LTPREFSIEVVKKLVAQGFTAYWAGGCVRDLLLETEADDYDVATDATPDQVRELFGQRRTLAVGASFGVIIVLGPRGAGQVEVATFRSEGEYTDGRRPDDVAFCSPEEDAQRRDFTVNGMFLDPITDTIHDFVGGEADLKRKVIRAIGDPHKRFDEDRLRLLRAVRFTANLEFELDGTTADAVLQLAGEVVTVSMERISQELRKMLSNRNRVRAVTLLRELGLLASVIPEVMEWTVENEPSQSRVSQWDEMLAVLGRFEEARFESTMAVLLRDVPSQSRVKAKDVPRSGTQQAICRRLKLSNDETDAICWLGSQRSVLEDVSAMQLHEKKRLLTHPLFDELAELEMSRMQVSGASVSAVEKLLVYRDGTDRAVLDPPELLTGRDLIQMGHRPGPEFKEWLYAIQNAQLDEQIQTRDEAVALLKELIGES